MSFVVGQESQQRSPKHAARFVPWLPLVLEVISAVAIGIWHLYASLALSNVKVIASLISIPLPHAFSHGLPTLLAVSVALVVVMAVLTAAMYAWRGLQQLRVHRGQAVSSKAQGRRLAACVGVLNALQFGLAVWLMVMMAISMLWFGGGMVAAKATTDAVATMSVVDEMLPRLIKNAVGIDPKKEGYLVHVSGRDVDIGSSTCSLFCFTLARAMLADNIDCTCNEKLALQLMPPGGVTADIQDADTCRSSPVMCTINSFATSMYKQHMKPALLAVVIATLSTLLLLCLLSGTTARITQELQAAEDLSRCSSVDGELRVDSCGDDLCTTADQKQRQPRKTCGKVCSLV